MGVFFGISAELFRVQWCIASRPLAYPEIYTEVCLKIISTYILLLKKLCDLAKSRSVTWFITPTIADKLLLIQKM